MIDYVAKHDHFVWKLTIGFSSLVLTVRLVFKFTIDKDSTVLVLKQYQYFFLLKIVQDITGFDPCLDSYSHTSA